MRKFAHVIACITLVFTANCLFAQPMTTFSGTVVSAETGEPLIGANVIVAELAVGAATDMDGKFSFTMALNREIKLVVSYMGFIRQELTISPGDQTTNLFFEMETDVIGLETIVVTALGLTKEEKAVGYSIQSVGGQRLTEVAETNIVSNLSGKAAGVQVTTSSGTIGASARIQIRGISSLTGDNQPLFVVDGVPIDNSTYGSGTYGGVVDFGNAASDISANDIESVNILKGANAAALYGSRALNGVIEITTKTGRGTALSIQKGLGISYTNHITFRTLNRLPQFQNKYGQGSTVGDPVGRASYGEFAYYDGDYGGINDGVDESWGPPLDGYLSEYYDEWYGDHERMVVQGEGQPLLIPQFTSPFADGTVDPRIASWDRTPTPWVSNPDNVYNYFKTGFSQEHNISIYGGNQWANFRASLTRQDDAGIIPDTDQQRNSVYLSGNIQASPKLSISAVANYVNLKNDNLMGNGYSGRNAMQQFTGWFGRQVDMEYLKNNVIGEDGTPYRWNYSYHDNPYWIVQKNINSRLRNRMLGHVRAEYKFTDWIALTARLGTDFFVENRIDIRAKYTNDNPDGRFVDASNTRRETNLDFYLTVNRSFMNEDLSVNFLAGANFRSNRYKSQSTTVDGLIIPDLYAVSNAAVTPTTGVSLSETEHHSVYGRLTFGFKEYLFLDVTGRNDWSSTLPEDNRSYFYPSVTGSFLFTEAFDIDPKMLYGKLRASWAVVGNTASPYSLIGTYSSAQPFMGFANLTYGNTMANSDLKPEEKTSIEVGTDLRFFSNRLGLSFTYYKENTINQIMPITVSGTTGFTSKWINAGEIQNQGVEVNLYGTPVEMGKFAWDVDVNWAKNKNEVISLYGDVESLEIFGGVWGGLEFLARPGEPWGQMFGYPTKSYQGKPVLRGGTGYWAGTYWADTGNPSVLGNILPDWTGGIRNTFTYGNLSLSALIDMSIGGDIFSVTNMFGWYAGILEETVTGTDEAKPVTGGDIRREGGVIIDGWQEVTDDDGNVIDYVENDVAAYGSAWGQCYWPSLGGHEISIFDASWIKLRSVTLSYRVPLRIVSKIGLMGATISLEGRNLLILHKNVPNIDPETGFTAGIVQGVEQNQLPSTRVFGMSIKIDL